MSLDEKVEGLLIDDLKNFGVVERSFDIEERSRFDVLADEWAIWRRGGLTFITSIARATDLLGRHNGNTLKTSEYLRSGLFALYGSSD